MDVKISELRSVFLAKENNSMAYELGVKVDRDKNGAPRLTDGAYRFSVLIKEGSMVVAAIRGFKATRSFDAMSCPSTLVGRGFWYTIVTVESKTQEYLLNEVRTAVEEWSPL